MSEFLTRLREASPDSTGRRWVYVTYDQLSDRIGPLSRHDPHALGIVLVENAWKAERRPYHKQKLAAVLANQRHFALEQAARGVAVRYVFGRAPYHEILAPIAAELGPLDVMVPAEREMRADLAPLVSSGALRLQEHNGWLTTPEHFRASQSGRAPWRMDAFYRHVRRALGVLMEDGDAPAGGKYSFDMANRRRWPGEPEAPSPPRFPVEPLKAEVARLIERRFPDHPGRLDLEALPASREDAATLWAWARQECLPHFGPYQDAMSTRSVSLFHTRISTLLNLQRLLPADLLDDVLADHRRLGTPIASVEGFVRQLLGWREFVRHVHRETDGFRTLPGAASPEVRPDTGSGGYARWSGHAWPSAREGGPDGGAAPSALGASRALPVSFWGRRSGLACLDRVIDDVWQTGYGHHITRLMVLANLATLLDVDPRQVTDWFWIAYTDAYDWVVEPNVLGMGTYAVGDLMTTKPYVSGAAYISRMGDYCEGCRFNPRSNCPITGLYWAFLARHRDRLHEVPRLRLPLANLERRPPTQRRLDRETFRWVSRTLADGEELIPEDSPVANE